MMKRTILASAILVLISSLAVADAAAQTKVRVKFARGGSAATMRGSITGYRYADYVLRAKAGQTIVAKVSSAESSIEFVIFKPDMDNLDGMFSETDWSGVLPVSGNYTIRVLMPRSAARRKTTADYRLSISLK